MKYLILILILILFICGCSEPTTKAVTKPVKLQTTPNFSWVELKCNEVKGLNGVGNLNDWINDNPDKRIVGFDGILAYRDRFSGFVIYHVPVEEYSPSLENSFKSAKRVKQTFVRVPNEYWFVDTLQKNKDNDKRRLVAFCSVHKYSGGAEGWVLLFEEDM